LTGFNPYIIPFRQELTEKQKIGNNYIYPRYDKPGLQLLAGQLHKLPP
jgi:hypothetical protein